MRQSCKAMGGRSPCLNAKLRPVLSALWRLFAQGEVAAADGKPVRLSRWQAGELTGMAQEAGAKVAVVAPERVALLAGALADAATAEPTRTPLSFPRDTAPLPAIRARPHGAAWPRGVRAGARRRHGARQDRPGARAPRGRARPRAARPARAGHRADERAPQLGGRGGVIRARAERPRLAWARPRRDNRCLERLQCRRHLLPAACTRRGAARRARVVDRHRRRGADDPQPRHRCSAGAVRADTPADDRAHRHAGREQLGRHLVDRQRHQPRAARHRQGLRPPLSHADREARGPCCARTARAPLAPVPASPHQRTRLPPSYRPKPRSPRW